MIALHWVMYFFGFCGQTKADMDVIVQSSIEMSLCQTPRTRTWTGPRSHHRLGMQEIASPGRARKGRAPVTVSGSSTVSRPQASHSAVPQRAPTQCLYLQGPAFAWTTTLLASCRPGRPHSCRQDSLQPAMPAIHSIEALCRSCP